MKSEITIGVTDCEKFENYKTWFEAEPGVSVIRLSQHENNLADIEKCDGVVLSGGEDVHPKLYNKPEYIADCHVNHARDTFEWKVLEHVKKESLPLLGICRGLQITNVFFGGTLIPDILKSGKPNHSKFPQDDRYHAIKVNAGTLLSKVTAASGEINSSHHQSADKLGEGLIANSFSPDGIIEGIERKNPSDSPFLLLVQWHPERMNDQENVFSKNIKKSFLKAVAEKA
jgi:putative glutamine amidotransferase